MSAATVARLKITLDNVKPAVLRRVEVPFDIRLDRLHTAVLTGWLLRSDTWPCRGAAPRDAGLHERHQGPTERLPGAVGTIRGCRGRGWTVTGDPHPHRCNAVF
jgi:Plasmid pRiA4b ORF-3-like protein